MMNKITEEGKNLIKHFEGIHDGDLTDIGLSPKLCPANVWTEGWGRAMVDKNGKFLTSSNTTYQRALSLRTIHNVVEAENALQQDMEDRGSVISRLVKVPMTDNMYNALISFAYNIGLSAFRNSTMLRLLNQGKKVSAANAMLAWNKATVNGKKVVLNGLVRRRAAERELFLK
jgi:lysozyme